MNHEEIFFSHIMGKAKVNTNNDVQFPEEHLHNSTTQALAHACWAPASQPMQQFDLGINLSTKKSSSVSFLNRCRKLFLAKTCCNKSAPVRERGVQIGRCFLSRCCWHSLHAAIIRLQRRMPCMRHHTTRPCFGGSQAWNETAPSPMQAASCVLGAWREITGWLKKSSRQ